MEGTSFGEPSTPSYPQLSFPDFSPSQNLTILTLGAGTEAEMLTAISLQGIVNSAQSRIYVELPDSPEFDRRLLSLLRERHNVSTREASLDSALEQYLSEVNGLIVYDPTRPVTVNVATTLAGIHRGLLVDSEGAANLATRHSLDILEDLREEPWRGLQGPDLYELALNRLLPLTNSAVLGYLRPDRLEPRDYLIASRAFVFYAEVGPLAGLEQISLLREVLDRTSTNSLVMGWARDVTGAAENFLVQELSSKGKTFLPGEETPNLSLLAAFHPTEPLRQTRSPTALVQEDRVYVSLAIPDGDNLDFARGRMQELWDHPVRGSLPISWSISPALTRLAPAYLELLYSEATSNDVFFAGPSGVGYVYPGLMPSNALQNHLDETRGAMLDADLRAVWLLNTFRPYEIPYPEPALTEYATRLAPDGLLLDYGDRPTTYSYWMVGESPAARPIHYWGSFENLLENVRLDLTSVDAPHFIVIALYPFTKDLGDLEEAVHAISAMDSRVTLVSIEDMFSLMLQGVESWAERVGDAVGANPLIRLLSPATVDEANQALTLSRAARATGDHRAGATEGFRAILLYHEASRLSVLTLAVSSLSVLLVASMVFKWRRSGLPRLATWKVMAGQVLAGASLISLVVLTGRSVLDGNFWDYGGLLGAVVAVAVGSFIFRRWNAQRTLMWVGGAAGLALGSALIIWTSLGLIPLALGAALLLGHVHGKGIRSGTVLAAAIGAGGLMGILLPWNLAIIGALLVVSLLSSWAVWRIRPPVEETRDAPTVVRYSLALLSVFPLLGLALLWSAFFPLRLGWNLGLTQGIGAVVLLFTPLLGLSFARSVRTAWWVPALLALALLIAAAFAEGEGLVILLLLGISSVVWAFISVSDRLRRDGVAPQYAAIAVGAILLLMTFMRIQPIYYSVYVAQLPGAVEYLLHTPTLLAALLLAVAYLGIHFGLRRRPSPRPQSSG